MTFWDEEPLKMPFDFLFCWPSTAGHAAYLNSSLFWSSLEETKVSFASGYQLEIASRLGMGMIPFLPSAPGRQHNWYPPMQVNMLCVLLRLCGFVCSWILLV